MPTTSAARVSTTSAARLPKLQLKCWVKRWGWTSKNYIGETLNHFRDGKFPADGFISDFFFFTSFNDYDIPPTGNAS